jgi:large subunit ribosomal protein L3
MARRHKPRRGSLGFWPRKRAIRPVARLRSWPAGAAKPHVQGFAGYKVGMTHAFLVDYRKRSTTAGQEVSVPVTVVETPPLKVAGVRLYARGSNGRFVAAEAWAEEPDAHLSRRLPVPEKFDHAENRKKLSSTDGEDVHLLVMTQPHLLTGTPSKTPEIFEVRVSGEDLTERKDFALGLLGKEVALTDFAKEGDMVDIIAVTKGKGFQGHTKRFGVKLQPRKNSKHRRMIGTLGPHNPSYVTYRIPQAGQMGYHRRTEYNKRILKIVKDPRAEPLRVAGGFPHYGEIRASYLLLHGSIPGPAKRIIRLRVPMRFTGSLPEKVDVRYLSTASKQGS